MYYQLVFGFFLIFFQLTTSQTVLICFTRIALSSLSTLLLFLLSPVFIIIPNCITYWRSLYTGKTGTAWKSTFSLEGVKNKEHGGKKKKTKHNHTNKHRFIEKISVKAILKHARLPKIHQSSLSNYFNINYPISIQSSKILLSLLINPNQKERKKNVLPQSFSSDKSILRQSCHRFLAIITFNS